MTDTIPVAYYKVLLELAHPVISRYTERQHPLEAVGIIADDASLYPLINQRRSSTEFMVSRVLVEEAMESLRKQDRYGVALYHSHPSREAAPSDRDIAMMRVAPKTVFVIHGTDKLAAYLCDDKGSDPRLLVEVPNE